MNKKNKGAISWEVFIIFTFLIVGLVISLYFIFRLNPAGETEKQICHNSVVTRSSSALLREVVPVPLNCKTSYVCLSEDGSCEKMTSPEVIKVSTKEEVYKSLAEEGANCWWLFGEGRLDYVGNAQLHTSPTTLYKSDLYCSICSQIAFDDSLESLFSVNPSLIARANLGIPPGFSNSLIDKEDFYEYLSRTNVSGKDISYLNYFLGLKNSEQIIQALKTNGSNFGYIDIQKQHFIMMGEFSQVTAFQNILEGAMKGVLLFLVLPIPVVGGPSAITLLVSTQYDPFDKGGGYLLGTIRKGESGHTYLIPTIVEANSKDYKGLNCIDINTFA